MTDAPFMYWVGMDTPAGTPDEEIERFNDFYSNVHAGEVLAANPGFLSATRYKLLEQDARGEFGPRWLVIYEMDGKRAADSYIERNDGPPERRPVYSPGPSAWQQYRMRWRLLWRRLVPQAGDLGSAGALYIYLVGMDAPRGSSPQELDAFNDFYTNTHLPEVVEAYGFLRARRYELYRSFVHPEPGAPGFLAVYEADEASLARRAERLARPENAARLSSGPPAWEAHVTAWRLTYRRLSYGTA